MDSGNSGSMQSSSGGDEEYDSSRAAADSIPTFLNHSSNYGPISNPQQPPPPHPHHHHSSSSSSFFVPPPSNYPNSFPQFQTNSRPTSLLNNDVVWSRGLQPDPATYTTLGNLTSSSTTSSRESIFGAQGQAQASYPSSSTMLTDQITNNAVVKNPKKRTRASRRAPTTVLTTDTSNFRAMVQEFTGIPAPPFSGSSYSRRLDLFGTGSAIRSGHLESLGSLYPLKPSAQKIQPTPFMTGSSSSLLNSSTVDAANLSQKSVDSIAATTSNALNLDPSNYQLPSQNMLNMQNPMLNFQSLLQPPPSFPSPLKYPIGDAAIFGLDVNSNLSGYHGHVASETAPLRNNNNVTNWRDGGAVTSETDHRDQLRSCNENYGVSGFKLNCSASSSDHFHSEKGLENVSSRGEGTVDSWICPSD